MRSAGVEWERNAWNGAFVLGDSAVASLHSVREGVAGSNQVNVENGYGTLTIISPRELPTGEDHGEE